MPIVKCCPWILLHWICKTQCCFCCRRQYLWMSTTPTSPRSCRARVWAVARSRCWVWGWENRYSTGTPRCIWTTSTSDGSSTASVCQKTVHNKSKIKHNRYGTEVRIRIQTQEAEDAFSPLEVLPSAAGRCVCWWCWVVSSWECWDTDQTAWTQLYSAETTVELVRKRDRRPCEG